MHTNNENGGAFKRKKPIQTPHIHAIDIYTVHASQDWNVISDINLLDKTFYHSH